MKAFAPLFVVFLAAIGCNQPTGPSGGTATPGPATTPTLVEARKGFQTRLTRQEKANEPVATPPAKVFRTVQYDAPPGKLAAYLSPDPQDRKKHPAIIWITGGDCNTIGDMWANAPPANDQTASAFRKAGVVMMFPSLRGGNQNPGTKEGFLGEVDDVIAAADFLARQPYVDPSRIYLGGHSTGGTLVLLVSECSNRFRAVFSFGPVDDIRGYGPEFLPFDANTIREAQLRSPGPWLDAIQSPTFVLEGSKQGNVDSLKQMATRNANPKVQFFEVKGGNHFDILAPINRLLAEKVLRDDGLTCTVSLTEDEIRKAMGR